MVDLVRDRRRELTQRVVRELGHVHDGVEPLQIRRGQPPDVPTPSLEAHLGIVLVEARGRVEPGVDPNDVVPSRGEIGAQDRADVPLAAGDEDSHATARRRSCSISVSAAARIAPNSRPERSAMSSSVWLRVGQVQHPEQRLLARHWPPSGLRPREGAHAGRAAARTSG